MSPGTCALSRVISPADGSSTLSAGNVVLKKADKCRIQQVKLISSRPERACSHFRRGLREGLANLRFRRKLSSNCAARYFKKSEPKTRAIFERPILLTFAQLRFSNLEVQICWRCGTISAGLALYSSMKLPTVLPDSLQKPADIYCPAVARQLSTS